MKLNINAIPEYAVWRFGKGWLKVKDSEKKANPTRRYSFDGCKGRNCSKLAKKLVRNNIKNGFRLARMAKNSGSAEQSLQDGVLKDKHLNVIKKKRSFFK